MPLFPRTKTELAAWLGVSLSTVKRWLKTRGLHVPRGIIPPPAMRDIIRELGYEYPEPDSRPQGRQDHRPYKPK